jgi:uncharacterized membrane protein
MMVLDLVMRFLHILSAVTLVGGTLAWRLGMVPALAPLATDVKAKVGNAIAASWRPWMLSAMGGLLVSGIWQYMSVKNPPSAWHAVIGVKFLLVLHIFAVGFLVTQQNNEKRARQLTGIVISGVIVVALAAVLRYLSAGSL